MPFFAIFLILAWFALVDGRLSYDEGPIISIGGSVVNLVIRAFRWLQLYPSAYPCPPSYSRAAYVAIPWLLDVGR
ncbi:hypothetical protein ARMGADRAFT_1168665 [Armillaria gallica]|uniref:Uncharacterized protein n=1 Tax=Armillaria gallica TaxID=47427 RepID=A0A2H3DGC9_ARMGA|nr:hypothetical protein ARMGADRAFT_1168665 [Armillaria gallica]